MSDLADSTLVSVPPCSKRTPTNTLGSFLPGAIKMKISILRKYKHKRKVSAAHVCSGESKGGVEGEKGRNSCVHTFRRHVESNYCL